MDGNVICNIGRNTFVVRNMKHQKFEIISECWDPSDRHFRVLEPFQASFYNKQNNMNCLRYHKKSVSSKIRVAHGRPNFCFQPSVFNEVRTEFRPAKNEFRPAKCEFWYAKTEIQNAKHEFQDARHEFQSAKIDLRPPTPPYNAKESRFTVLKRIGCRFQSAATRFLSLACN